MTNDQIKEVWDLYQKDKEGYSGQLYGHGPSYVELGLKYGNPWLAATAKDYMEMFGRLPTATEAAEAMASYHAGGDVGSQFVAQKWQQENAAQQQVSKAEKERALVSEKSKQYYDAVGKQFQDIIGRDATDEEKDYFSKLLYTGDMSPYQLRNIIQQTPEYVRPLLEKQDTEYFQQKLQPAIESSFAQRGRDVRSSGFASALAQGAMDLSREREKYLQGISREDYLNTLGRAYGVSSGAQDLSTNLYLNNLQRSQGLTDYSMQKAAYDEYLRKYGGVTKNRGLNALQGAASGALAGGSTGNIWGAVGGGIAGGLLGGLS